MWVVRIIEPGFLVPLEPSGPDRSSDGKFRLLRLAGVEHQLPYFEVGLTNPSDMSALLVIVTTDRRPPLSDKAVEASAAAIAAHFTDAALVMVREDREGWARVSCADPMLDELAAAASAIVKASAGWTSRIRS